MRRIPIRLGARLVVSLLLTGVLPVAIAGYLTRRDQEGVLRAEALDHARQVAELLAGRVDFFVRGVREDLSVLADTPALRAAILHGNWADARRVLGITARHHPDLRALVVADEAGRARAATGVAAGLSGQDVSARPHFALASARRRLAVSDPFRSPLDGRPVLGLAIPILEGDRIAAILGAAVDLNILAAEVHQVKWGAGGFAVLQTAEGRIIIHPDPSRVLAMASESTRAPVLTRGAPAGARETVGPDGTRDLTGFAIVPNLGWVVLARVPKDKALAHLTVLRRHTMTLVGWLLIMVVAVALVHGRVLARPMRELAAAARALGAGELERRVPVRREDEIGEVARAFNEMADRRQRAEEALRASLARRDAFAHLLASIASAAERSEVLRQVVTSTARLLRAPYAVLWTVDPSGTRLIADAEFSDPGLGPIPPQPPILLDRSLATSIMREGSSVAVPDVRAIPTWGNPTWPGLELLGAYVGVPLAKEASLLGVLAAMDRPGRHFTAEEIALVGSLGTHAALAIEKASLLEDARKAAEQAQALVEIGKLLTETMDMDLLLSRVAEKAVRLFGGAASSVGLVDPGGDAVDVWFRQADDSASNPRVVNRLRPEESLFGKVFRARRAVWTSDFLADPDLWFSGETRQRIMDPQVPRAVLVAPMVRGEAVIGGLAMHRPAGATYSPAEVQVLTALASQAAIAIENARLYAQANEALRGIEALYEAGQAVTQSLDVDDTLTRIAEAARRLAGADRAFVWLLDRTDGGLESGIAVGPGAEAFVGIRLPADSPAAASRAAREGRVIAVENAAISSEHDQSLSARFGNAAMVAIPLQVQATVLGVLVCAYSRPRAFAAKTVEQLGSLARHAAIALEHARLYGEAERRRKEAEEALTNVKQLQGLLPICSYCKKVRDDKNYWHQVEAYIADHSETTFSHGICPDCYEKVVKPEMERVRTPQRPMAP